ncbi:uncharacterized protein LOC131648749 [Vicia villosa]|uniref:uncharacterized protein LOC131648749 n=1 Tax=Vicia villosa TaxID=3911 RepID=UPI00273B8D88|nr:uncharacterized protein LOC131648749 [Vicia villosa]
MHPTKSPGLDGLPALFYQKYFPTIGNKVILFVLDILNNNGDPAYKNNTFITLIPKKKNPATPMDFRPINLCNVIMKTVTKAIANRLKVFLPEVISEEQSSFIRGRLITDNALIAMECFHWMKHKKKGRKGTMALKLDMSKAYDIIEWSFVTETLHRMEFPTAMVSLIHKCISTVSYQLLINDHPSKLFFPGRGMIKNAVNERKIHGIKVARKSPIISHLFFADDSLLFARASEEEAERIQGILTTYELASGQVVNANKSEVSFSGNIGEDARDRIRAKLGFRGVNNHSRYLGLPVVFGRSKKEVFKLVAERVWKKFKGWKENFLSRAGKEVLIKAVAQAIPTYIMSCYHLPESCCKEIEALLAKFCWGSKDGERKIHWIRWERLAHCKGDGGIGFQGICDFNISLLWKQYWRLLQANGSLMERFFKGRYYPQYSLSDAQCGFLPSFAWRSILSSKEVVLNGSRWRIGNGEKVRIGEDRWIPSLPGFQTSSPARVLDPTTKKHKGNPGPSSKGNQNLWKQIWKVKVNPTIRNFLWRLTKDILPTKANLMRKGTPSNGLYPLCNSGTEDTLHPFLRCDFVKRTLFSGSLGIRVPEEGDLLDWLCHICSKKDTLLFQFVAVNLWKIWQVHNCVVFKDIRPNPCVVAAEIWSSIQEETDGCSLSELVDNNSVINSNKQHGWIVQNGAGCFDDGVISFGCIIRDPTSNIFLAATKRSVSITEASNAELLAIRWSLQVAKDLGLKDFVVQSDALVMVDCINGVVFNADLDPIVADCRNLISGFNNVRVMFIRRTLNGDAHHLVCLGKSLGYRTWTGHIPSVNHFCCSSVSSS